MQIDFEFRFSAMTKQKTLVFPPIWLQKLFLKKEISSFGLVDENLIGSLGHYKDLLWPFFETEVFKFWTTNLFKVYSLFLIWKCLFLTDSSDQINYNSQAKFLIQIVSLSAQLVPLEEILRTTSWLIAGICSNPLIFSNTLFGVVN